MSQYVWELFLVILGAVLLPIFEYARLQFYISPLYRKTFNFNRRASISLIIPTLRHDQFSSKEFISFTTPLESVMTMQSMGAILRKLDLSSEILQVRFSQAVSPGDLENNIVLVGGPTHNSVTREFMKHFKDFFFDGRDVVSKITGTRYQSIVEDKLIIKDIAILAVTPNPWSTKHRAVLVAGSRGFASIGLLHYAKTQELLRLVVGHKNFIPNKNFIAVFSLNVDHVCANSYGFSNLVCEELNSF